LPEKSAKIQFIGQYFHYHKNKKKLVSFVFVTLQIFPSAFCAKSQNFSSKSAFY